MKNLLFIVPAALLIVSCGTSKKAVSNDGKHDTVNIGYGDIKKDNNTFSVSQVKPKDKEISSYSNIYDYLRGRVPGVEVRSDNTIIVRGVSSNGAYYDPLFIVDGVQTDNISNIPPTMIESVTVLKDGSASIYGSQSGNGVILIETKR